METPTDDAEVPDAIRKELMTCAIKTGISYHWLCGIWVDGFKTKHVAGATGTFPEGTPLSPGDYGELRLAMGVDWQRKKVLLNFGKSISWAFLTSQQCRLFADALTKSAHELDQNPMDN